jgi:hypothetical protein
MSADIKRITSFAALPKRPLRRAAPNSTGYEEQAMAVGIIIVVLVGISRIRSQGGLQPSSTRAMFA